MPTYDSENRFAIEFFAKKYYPEHSVKISEDLSCRYDAKILDEDGAIVAIIESKARPISDSKYDHIIQDFDKLQILISIAAQLNCEAYIIHYFFPSSVLYTHQLRDSLGNIDIKAKVTYEPMRANNFGYDKVMKVTSRILLSDCNKITGVKQQNKQAA